MANSPASSLEILFFGPGYYDKVLEILPAWITRIMIVGSVQHGPDSPSHTASWDYFAEVVHYFEEAGTRRNFTVGTRMNCAPDDDFVFMASAKWCGAHICSRLCHRPSWISLNLAPLVYAGSYLVVEDLASCWGRWCTSLAGLGSSSDMAT